jgi:hypothetical protein
LPQHSREIEVAILNVSTRFSCMAFAILGDDKEELVHGKREKIGADYFH